MSRAGGGRVRADVLLVSRGLAPSREKAQALIMAGEVITGDRRVDKPGALLAADAEIHVAGRARFVSRGGDKLEAAIESFGLDVAGAVCLDAGCSTGGFTDCLLQRGAARVYAVDVGYGQFAWPLRQDARVVLRERTNVRSIDPASLDPRPDLVVADLSFVSLGSILPSLVRLASPAGAAFVLLAKPQFEVAATDTDHGVVVSQEVREAALARVQEAVREAGLELLATMESPLRGAEGNVEFLLYARAGARR
jgi:23S rRNA (cytidine1920-2'-O)/16S rRNA (cytidine1409-2'-O)-methyltransferase